jgi:hypothetical protein
LTQKASNETGRLPGKSGFGPDYSQLLPATPGYSRGVTEPAGAAGSCRDLIAEFAGSSQELVLKCGILIKPLIFAESR